MKKQLTIEDLIEFIFKEISNNTKMTKENESKLFELLNVISQHKKGKSILLESECAYPFKYVENGETIKLSLIHKCVQMGYITIIQKLIEIGLPVDIGTTSDNHTSEFFALTPLMEATRLGEKDIVKILIEAGANIAHQNGTGKNALMETFDFDIFSMLISAARSNGTLLDVISQKNARKMNVFQELCYKDQGIPLLELLLTIPEYYKKINVLSLLFYARTAAFRGTSASNQFDRICFNLRKIIDDHNLARPEVNFSLTDNQSISLESSFKLLFNKKPFTTITSKSEAIEYGLSQLYTIFQKPVLCIPILKEINNAFEEFLKAHKNTQPIECRKDVRWITINAIKYPIPLPTFQAAKKGSALQLFLLQLLQNHGLGESIYTWGGFVPMTLGNSIVSQGHIFVEDRKGSGLFHGKLSHMLQFAMIIFLRKENVISLSYTENNEKKEVSLKELFNYLVMNTREINPIPYWSIILDAVYDNVFTFSDPFQISSSIMHEGEEWEISTLSNYMLDSFCKGILKLFELYKENQLVPQELSLDEFSLQLTDLELGSFVVSPKIFSSALHHHINSGHEVKSTDQKTYYIVQKSKYGNNPNSLFALTASPTDNLNQDTLDEYAEMNKQKAM